MTAPSRTLTVAHQQPGECAYCDDRHNRIVAAVAHELAETIRATAFADTGPGTTWNWWDAATIPGSCADLIDPPAEPAP
ncbi:hypothetical protein ACWENO_13950 [Streptomyces sp. NPDC004436]